MQQSMIDKLNVFFLRQPVEKAWIFGSYSRNKETQDSDIDVLVRFDRNATITLFKYAAMIEELQKLLRKKIDLVEEGQVKDFAKDAVEQDKILVYERKP